jgi:plasmid stabilization system protein ParE
MPETIIRVHPEALREAENARDWYARRSVPAAFAFINELTLAVELLKESPRMWPAFSFGTRRYPLARFPFSIIYRLKDDELIEIVALMDHKKKPGYWAGRV